MNGKNIFSLLLISLLLMACNEPATDSNTTASADTTATSSTTTATTPEPAQNMAFEGSYVLNESKDKIIGVEIKAAGQAAVFQNLTGLDFEYEAEHPVFEKPKFEDLNFDGHSDMMLPEGVGNANIFYVYWIYNPATKQLERNTEMTLCLPKVNKEEEFILSSERNSAAEYSNSYYKYKDGHFVLAKSEDIVYEDEKTYQIVIKELQADGSMKEVVNEVRTEG